MNKTTIIVAVVAIIIGAGIGQAMKAPDPVVKEVVKEVPVVKEVEKNGDTWRELKSVDDQAFSLAGEQMQLCSAGFYAASNLDVGTLEAIGPQMQAKTAEMKNLGTKRQSLLKELGY